MEKRRSLPASASIGLLQGVVGRRVTGLVRYSWWVKEEVANECEVEKNDSFSLTYGPLGIAFEDGTVIGMAEQPSLNSIVVWLDRADGIAVRHPALDEKPSLFPIDAKDSEFSRQLLGEIVGERLVRITILKQRTMDALLNSLPSEVGLCFEFAGGQRLVAERGLHVWGGDFAVIRYEQIPEEVRMDLVELPLI